MTGTSADTDGIRTRRTWVRRNPKGATALLVAVLLAGAGLTTWSTSTWPFDEESYCWGAWEANSGPRVLDDDGLGSGDAREGKQSTGPAKERMSGSCSLRIVGTARETGAPEDYEEPDGSDGSDRSDRSEQEVFQSVDASVGSVPRAEGKRRAWMETYLSGRAVALPDGVPGVVGTDRAMVVLPRTCDVDGLPATVTLRGGWTTTSRIGTEREVTDLLLALANRVLEKTGCASGERLEVTSPIAGSGNDDSFRAMAGGMCRIPGLEFDLGKNDHYKPYVGVVGDRLQTCTVEDETDVRAPAPAGQFVMTSEPRLVALFDGMAGSGPPGKDWRGNGTLGAGHSTVKAMCHDRVTVFFLQLDQGLRSLADPDGKRVFARTVNSVAERIGCGSVAPRS